MKMPKNAIIIKSISILDYITFIYYDEIAKSKA